MGEMEQMAPQEQEQQEATQEEFPQIDEGNTAEAGEAAPTEPEPQEAPLEFPSQEQLLADQLESERQLREAQTAEIERLKTRHQQMAGRLGSQLDDLRRRLSTQPQRAEAPLDQWDGQQTYQEDRPQPVAPMAQPPADPAFSDMSDRMAALEKQQIFQEETARFQAQYPIVQRQDVMQGVTQKFLQHQQSLAGISDPSLYRAQLKNTLHQVLREVGTELSSTVAASSDSRLANKRKLATPAQTAPRTQARPSAKAPEDMTPRELFQAYIREGRPGFTQAEYERMVKDGEL